MNEGRSDSYIEKAIHLFMKTYNKDINFEFLLILSLNLLFINI